MCTIKMLAGSLQGLSQFSGRKKEICQSDENNFPACQYRTYFYSEIYQPTLINRCRYKQQVQLHQM